MPMWNFGSLSTAFTANVLVSWWGWINYRQRKKVLRQIVGSISIIYDDHLDAYTRGPTQMKLLKWQLSHWHDNCVYILKRTTLVSAIDSAEHHT